MTVSKVVSNVSDPEGPVSIGPSTWVITEMGTGAITRIGPAPEDRTTLATTGCPNGLVVDADGILWIAESRHRSLMRLDPELGEATVVTGSASGEALMWPNDLCIGPDGLIYLTDSGVDPDSFEGSSASERANMRLDGRVVVIDPTTREGRILDRGLQFANGIAIGPDGTSLYVAETLTGRIYRYPLADISSKTREVFGQVLRETPSSYDGIAGPDGMAFDSNGVLLVAVLTQGTLTTLSPDGGVLGHRALGDSFPTNVAFGGPEHKSVLVTGCATGTLLGLEWTVPGLRLHEELKG